MSIAIDVREGQRPGSAVVKRLEPNDLLNLLDLKLSEQGASEDGELKIQKKIINLLCACCFALLCRQIGRQAGRAASISLATCVLIMS